MLDFKVITYKIDSAKDIHTILKSKFSEVLILFNNSIMFRFQYVLFLFLCKYI